MSVLRVIGAAMDSVLSVSRVADTILFEPGGIAGGIVLERRVYLSLEMT